METDSKPSSPNPDIKLVTIDVKMQIRLSMRFANRALLSLASIADDLHRRKLFSFSPSVASQKPSSAEVAEQTQIKQVTIDDLNE